MLATRARTIRPPSGATAGFGSRVRVGDVDGDRHVDMVEGAPTQVTAPGHTTYCRGTARGPASCRLLGTTGGTSSLAVADVNGDRYADIVQGDSAHSEVAAGFPVSAGELRLWLGSRRGPGRAPIRITQNTPAVPDANEPGDEFGAVVEAGDVDSDGFADMVVAATRENAGAGRITVIRGGREGHASHGNSSFDQDAPTVPGRAEPDGEFGSTLTILSLTRDRRLDVAVAAQGEHTADERVMVLAGGPGVFAPGETGTSTLSGVGSLVHAPRGGHDPPGAHGRRLSARPPRREGFHTLRAFPAARPRRRLAARSKERRRAGPDHAAAPGAADDVAPAASPRGDGRHAGDPALLVVRGDPRGPTPRR